MKHILIVSVCASLAFAGCTPTTEPAEGKPQASEKTKVTLAALPKVAANESRLIVYRTSYVGLAIQPIVSIDGKKTERCTPGTSFAVDLKPGQHSVGATTEVKRTTVVTIRPGETAYVRCSVGIGLIAGRPVFEQVSQGEALKKASKLRLKGQP